MHEYCKLHQQYVVRVHHSKIVTVATAIYWFLPFVILVLRLLVQLHPPPVLLGINVCDHAIQPAGESKSPAEFMHALNCQWSQEKRRNTAAEGDCHTLKRARNGPNNSGGEALIPQHQTQLRRRGKPSVCCQGNFTPTTQGQHPSLAGREILSSASRMTRAQGDQSAAESSPFHPMGRHKWQRKRNRAGEVGNGWELDSTFRAPEMTELWIGMDVKGELQDGGSQMASVQWG